MKLLVVLLLSVAMSAQTKEPTARIVKLETDLSVLAEAVELQLTAIHAVLVRLEKLEAASNNAAANSSSGTTGLNRYTVATLPGNVPIGTEVLVTDSWLGGCAIGGGDKQITCVRTADGWQKKLPTFADLVKQVERLENMGTWRGLTVADLVKRVEKLEEKRK